MAFKGSLDSKSSLSTPAQNYKTSIAFMGSLDSLRRRGLLALYGAASGPVPPFDLQLLSQKGSLFLTRPSLHHYAHAARIKRSAVGGEGAGGGIGQDVFTGLRDIAHAGQDQIAHMIGITGDFYRGLLAEAAGDGRHELYKISLRYDNPQTRLPHDFPLDITQKEVQEMLYKEAGGP